MKNIFNVEVWIYPDNLKVTRGHKLASILWRNGGRFSYPPFPCALQGIKEG
jgi:hypothetical protein